MIKQIVMHEIIIALIVLAAESLVLIQIHRPDLRKVKIALFVPRNKLLVKADRRGACCQSQHAVRLHNHLCGNDIRRFPAHICIIFSLVYSHCLPLLPPPCGIYLRRISPCRVSGHPLLPDYSIPQILLRVPSTIDGATLSSSIPIRTKRSVSSGSAPSSPQIPTHLPALCAPSIVI